MPGKAVRSSWHLLWHTQLIIQDLISELKKLKVIAEPSLQTGRTGARVCGDTRENCLPGCAWDCGIIKKSWKVGDGKAKPKGFSQERMVLFVSQCSGAEETPGDWIQMASEFVYIFYQNWHLLLVTRCFSSITFTLFCVLFSVFFPLSVKVQPEKQKPC